MKTVKTIFYYFLIILSCLLGALAVGRTEFFEVIITLCYVYMAVFALLSVIIKRLRLSPHKLLFVKFLFLIFCIASTFFALRVTDEMLFEHELKCSAESVEIKSASIKPELEWGAYLSSIVFETSYDNFLDTANNLGLHQVDIIRIHPRSAPFSKVYDKLTTNTSETCTPKTVFSNENSYSLKTFVYDTETQTAYYEHLNHNDRGG